MKTRFRLLAVAILAIGGAACNSGRHSSAAFHLPPDADIDRGKAAFVDLGCNTCHEVSAVDLPKPTIQPPVPVSLGGVVDARLSDAYMVTSIIYPQRALAPYAKDRITQHGVSRMTHCNERMTVRQLTDIVAFLQSRYYVPRTPENYR